MARIAVTLDYADDTPTEEVRLTARSIVEAERQYKGSLPPIEGTLYAAWHQTGRKGTFDAWLDNVADFTEQTAEVGPTSPAVSADN